MLDCIPASLFTIYLYKLPCLAVILEAEPDAVFLVLTRSIPSLPPASHVPLPIATRGTRRTFPAATLSMIVMPRMWRCFPATPCFNPSPSWMRTNFAIPVNYHGCGGGSPFNDSLLARFDNRPSIRFLSNVRPHDHLPINYDRRCYRVIHIWSKLAAPSMVRISHRAPVTDFLFRRRLHKNFPAGRFMNRKHSPTIGTLVSTIGHPQFADVNGNCLRCFPAPDLIAPLAPNPARMRAGRARRILRTRSVLLLSRSGLGRERACFCFLGSFFPVRGSPLGAVFVGLLCVFVLSNRTPQVFGRSDLDLSQELGALRRLGNFLSDHNGHQDEHDR